MTNSSHNFWDFSLRIYQAAEVAMTCLSLQNKHHLDVNLVLFCLWYGTDYGPMPAPLLERAYKHSASWKENVVQPLRNTRSWMKSNASGEFAEGAEFETLRQRIKTVELDAEKIQQQALESIVHAAPYLGTIDEREKAVIDNLMLLLAMHETPASPELKKLLAILVSHAVPKAAN